MDGSSPLDLHQQFEALWLAQRFDAVLGVAEQELQTAETSEGPEHPAVVRALWDLSMACRAQGLTERSAQLRNQADELFAQLQKNADAFPDDPQTAVLLLFEADSLAAVAEKFDEIFPKYQRALSILESQLGPDDWGVAETLTRLAEAHYLAGQLAECEPVYRRAQAVYNRAPDRQSLWQRKNVEALARVLLENGQTEEALPYFEQALARPSLDEPARRRRYFLLLGYAQGLRLLGRSEKAALLEKEAQILLPQATPGEFGYHV